MRLLVRALVFVPAAAALSLGACGSEDDCEATRTCAGNGGGGGSGGTAGDGAAGEASKPCDDSSDCDDGLACNGEETCSQGSCQAGTPACTNFDPDHCEVTCTEKDGGAAECKTSARDQDGDNHGDIGCTISEPPGDDCDDSEPKAFPGNTADPCDGIDGDCDGVHDIDEGNILSGTPGDLVNHQEEAFDSDIAWSDSANAFGVIWTDTRDTPGVDEIYFALMDASGAKKGSDLRISPMPDKSRYASIAAGHNSFGIVWADDRNGKADIYFARVDDTGAPLGSEVQVTDDPGDSFFAKIAATASGWAVFWTDNRDSAGGRIYGRALDPAGSLKGNEVAYGTANTTNQIANVAVRGPEIAVVWPHGAGTGGDPTSVFLLRTDLDLAQKGLTTVASTTTPTKISLAKVTATESGWATAWGIGTDTSLTLRTSEQNADGTDACGPLSETGDGAHKFVGDIVNTNAGRFVVMGEPPSSPSKLTLVRFDPGCQSLPSIKLADVTNTAFSSLSGADVAVGPQAIAVVWQELAGGNLAIRRRVFGPNLCD